MTDFQVKVSLNDDIRRVSVRKNITFEELATLVRKLFNLGKDPVKIEYKDDEEDWVVATTDLELEEAKHTLAQMPKNMLRLRVNANVRKPNTPAKLEECLSSLIKQVCQSVPAIQMCLPLISQFIREVHGSKHRRHRHRHHHDSTKPTVHFGVQCDGCGKYPIEGMRYQCRTCEDFDFCSDCYGKVQHDASHPFIEISRPSKNKHCKKQCCQVEDEKSVEKKLEVKISPLSTPETKLHAVFIADITIEDESEVQPGTSFIKIWRMKNNGTVPFPVGTCLGFLAGDGMDGPGIEGVPVPCVPIGEEFEIEMNLTAPQQPGRYVGHWRLMDASKNFFGHRIWVDIVVPTESLKFNPFMAIPLEANESKHIIPIPTVAAVEDKDEVRSEKSDDEEYVKVEGPQSVEVKPKTTVEIKPVEVKPVETKVPEIQSPVQISVLPIDTKPSTVEVKPISEVKLPIVQEVKLPIVQEVKLPTVQEVKLPIVQEVKLPIQEVKLPIVQEVKLPIVQEVKLPIVQEVKLPVVQEVKLPIVQEVKLPIQEVKLPIVQEVKLPAVQEVKPIEAKKDVPKTENINWASALTQLSEMGFRDVKQNIALLKKHHGDIEKVISEIIQQKA